MGKIYNDLMNMFEDSTAQTSDQIATAQLNAQAGDPKTLPNAGQFDIPKGAVSFKFVAPGSPENGWNMQDGSFVKMDQSSANGATAQAAANKPRAWNKDVLGLGSRGPAVDQLRKDLGLAPNGGVYDQQTKDAVIALQKKLGGGLKADGAYGPLTRAAHDKSKQQKPQDGAGNQPQAATDAAQPAQAQQGPAPEGSVLDAKDIPWQQYDPKYNGKSLTKKKGIWTTDDWINPATAVDPAWVAQLEKIWASKPKAGTGNQQQQVVNPGGKVGDKGMPGDKTGVPTDESANPTVSFSQDPTLARIVELARK